MLPLAFSTSNPFSRDEVQRIKELGLLGLDYSAEGRYNVDGYLVYKVFASQESLLSASYLQVFRDYHLEAASSYILSYDEKKLFRFPTLERSLIEKIGRYLTYLRDNEVPPPVMVRLILLNAKGFGIWYRRMSIDDGRFPKLFDRDQIVLPDVQIENWDHLDNPDVVVRPLLDSYWNATGWPNSPSYNSNGRWEDQSPNAANWDL
jgi:hypothetical protein